MVNVKWLKEDFKNMNLKLKAKIVENFENQANFSQIVKVDETLISRIIRGRRELKPEEQTRWAAILNCKREEIFPAA